jgi:ribosomal protein L11 methylase PrmA
VTGAKIDTSRLQRLARAYTESATLYAALDLGLFSQVAKGAGTVDELAAAMDILPLNAERLVNACLAMGLLTRSEGRLANAADAERFLVEETPGYAAAWMTFTRPSVGEWFRLTEHLRSKEPPTLLGMYADLTVDEARAYHAATFSIGMGAGRRFARQVDLKARRKLLDLGGGSGAYSINAVQAYPELSAVVFDLPPVVEVTKEYLAEAGVEHRVTAQAGDFTRDALPPDVDAVVMASNLPIYDEEVIAAVVARAFAALLPGGEMHLVGEMLADDRSGPLDAAMWGLSEALTGGGGKAHTIAQCRGYFEQAGFIDIADAEFVAGTLHRVSGKKAA